MTTNEWFIAPSLNVLLKEINGRWPNRLKASDGGLGNASHAARKSDHNPDWDAPGRLQGVVRARDYTVVDVDTGAIQSDPELVLKYVLKDKRVNYVIWNKVIYSRSAGFKPRSYARVNPLGFLSNPHTHHIHVSILPTEDAAFDESPWGLEDEVTPEDRDAIVKSVVAELKPLLEPAAYSGTRRYMEQPIVSIGDELIGPDGKQGKSGVSRFVFVMFRKVAAIEAALTKPTNTTNAE